MNEILNEVEEVKLDKCVTCDAETPYTENTHIDYRNFYIEGCGQLCQNCYEKLYPPTNKNEILLG